MIPIKNTSQYGLETGFEECRQSTSNLTRTSGETKLNTKVNTVLRALENANCFHQFDVVREHNDHTFPSAISTIHTVLEIRAEREYVHLSVYRVKPRNAEYWFMPLERTIANRMLKDATV